MNTFSQVPSPAEMAKTRLMWGCMTRPKSTAGVENGAKKAIDVGVRDVGRTGIWRPVFVSLKTLAHL